MSSSDSCKYVGESLNDFCNIKIPKHSLMDSVDYFIVVMVCFDSFFIYNYELFEKK